MAAKAKKKTFNVERRIEVWVSSDITADSFDDAVAKAKELKVEDFVQTSYEGDGFIDYNWLPGFGVRENF